MHRSKLTSRTRLTRHDLVWLDPSRWRTALHGSLPDEWVETLDDWFAGGRPAVVRRQEPCTAATIALGVALSPARGKLKIPLVISRTALLHSRRPLALDEALCSAPDPWRPSLDALLDGARSLGILLRVYGSLAWQHLTGEPYLTPSSDVDLLWRAGDAEQITAMLQLLDGWQRTSGLIADGELLLADNSGVAWKELAARPRVVLVKHARGVAMRATTDVLGTPAEASC
jgi:phosphoribosyl-dephospho-CoA transferase